MTAIPKSMYVSGPMTGKPEHNIPAFRTMSAKLRSKGLSVVDPSEVDHSDHEHAGPGSGHWADYLRYDLIAMLESCTGILMLPGWRQSKGATLEHTIAMALGWNEFQIDEETDEVVKVEHLFIPALGLTHSSVCKHVQVKVEDIWRYGSTDESEVNCSECLRWSRQVRESLRS